VIASVVALTAARTGGHKPRVGLTAAGGASTTQPDPQAGTPGAPGVETSVAPTSTVVGRTASTITSGTAGTTPAPHATTTNSPTPTTARPPSTTPSPPGQPTTVTVTEADSGKSYTLHRGDRLVVQLQSSGYEWTEPASSNDTVLHRTGGSGGTSASATFSATAGGTADVTSTGDLPCRKATPPCMAPSRLFQVSVTVVG
jgi:hypothetical protein